MRTKRRFWAFSLHRISFSLQELQNKKIDINRKKSGETDDVPKTAQNRWAVFEKINRSLYKKNAQNFFSAAHYHAKF